MAGMFTLDTFGPTQMLHLLAQHQARIQADREYELQRHAQGERERQHAEQNSASDEFGRMANAYLHEQYARKGDVPSPEAPAGPVGAGWGAGAGLMSGMLGNTFLGPPAAAAYGPPQPGSLPPSAGEAGMVAAGLGLMPPPPAVPLPVAPGPDAGMGGAPAPVPLPPHLQGIDWRRMFQANPGQAMAALGMFQKSAQLDVQQATREAAIKAREEGSKATLAERGREADARITQAPQIEKMREDAAMARAQLSVLRARIMANAIGGKTAATDRGDAARLALMHSNAANQKRDDAAQREKALEDHHEIHVDQYGDSTQKLVPGLQGAAREQAKAEAAALREAAAEDMRMQGEYEALAVQPPSTGGGAPRARGHATDPARLGKIRQAIKNGHSDADLKAGGVTDAELRAARGQ